MISLSLSSPLSFPLPLLLPLFTSLSLSLIFPSTPLFLYFCLSHCLTLSFLLFPPLSLKLSCDNRFQHAFTACSCVFKVITLVWANQRNFFENAFTCSKRMRKTLVETQLKERIELPVRDWDHSNNPALFWAADLSGRHPWSVGERMARPTTTKNNTNSRKLQNKGKEMYFVTSNIHLMVQVTIQFVPKVL